MEIEELREQCRNDFLSFCMFIDDGFIPSWHHEEICKKIEDAVYGRGNQNLMIFMPPRHGKSTIVSKFFPAWFLGIHPDKKFILASYTASLPEGFSKDVRKIIESEEYKAIFPDTALATKGIEDLNTTKGGHMYAVGKEGGITGKGGHVRVVDDIVKGISEAYSKHQRDKDWDWYTKELASRSEPFGQINIQIIMMTLWHLDDLAHRVMELEGDNWDIVRYPAIAEEDEVNRKKGEPLWPDGYGLEALEGYRKKLGDADFNAQYQQSPVSKDSGYFTSDMFISKVHDGDKVLRYYTFVDPAISKSKEADNTVILTIGVNEDNYTYVVDVKAGKWSMNDTIGKLFSTVRVFNPKKVGIEAVAYQQALVDEARRRMAIENFRFNLEEVKRGGRGSESKEARIIGTLQARYGNREIMHSCNCRELEDELLNFPNGKHDDMIDALEGAVRMSQFKPKREGITFNQFIDNIDKEKWKIS